MIIIVKINYCYYKKIIIINITNFCRQRRFGIKNQIGNQTFKVNSFNLNYILTLNTYIFVRESQAIINFYYGRLLKPNNWIIENCFALSK